MLTYAKINSSNTIARPTYDPGHALSQFWLHNSAQAALVLYLIKYTATFVFYLNLKLSHRSKFSRIFNMKLDQIKLQACA